MCTDETEARIQQLTGKERANTAVTITTTRPSPPNYAAPWPTTADFADPTCCQCSLPSFAPSNGDAEAHANPATYGNLSFQQHDTSCPGSLNNDFLDSLQTNGSPRATTERNGSIFFGRDEDGRNHFTSTDVDMTAPLNFATFETDGHIQQQQHDQGQMNGSAPPIVNGSSAGSSSSPTLRDGTSTSAEVPAATAVVLANDATQQISSSMATVLAEFSSSVFHSQAEIAGMSSAVADYIAWMRKVPKGNAPPSTSLVYVHMLEAIENRLREMKDIAQTKPLAAFRDMLSSLKRIGPVGPSVYVSLGHLEKDFERQSDEVAHFFQTRYNACAALSEQAQNVPRGPVEARGVEDSTMPLSQRR